MAIERSVLLVSLDVPHCMIDACRCRCAPRMCTKRTQGYLAGIAQDVETGQGDPSGHLLSAHYLEQDASKRSSLASPTLPVLAPPSALRLPSAAKALKGSVTSSR
jgi:hypothetical protein